MKHNRWLRDPIAWLCITAVVALMVSQGLIAAEIKVSRYGNVHEALSNGKHEGKIELGKASSEPHCYGVGAVAKLKGEVTIVDGKLFVTTVNKDGKPLTILKPEKAQAAFLVTSHVPKWVELTIEKDLAPEQLETFVRKQATKAGLDPTKPFPFQLKGTFTSLDLHVINGTCPIRARLLEQPVAEGLKPFEASLKETRGRLVGFYAEQASGEIACHGALMHVHAVIRHKDKELTGHVEKVGVKGGTVLLIPAK